MCDLRVICNFRGSLPTYRVKFQNSKFVAPHFRQKSTHPQIFIPFCASWSGVRTPLPWHFCTWTNREGCPVVESVQRLWNPRIHFRGHHRCDVCCQDMYIALPEGVNGANVLKCDFFDSNHVWMI
jgi:hypothetical protein